jgi:transposase
MGALKGKLLNKIGKTQGGWTSRIHVVVDAKGRPIRVKVMEGNRNDNLFAKRLLNGKHAHYVVGDKAYDTVDIRKFIKKRKEEAVIPKQARYGHKAVQTYNKIIYKNRNLVERFFQRIKTWRGIASRYCKTNVAYEGIVIIACVLFWLAY